MEIYAELSKKDYAAVLDGSVSICIPEGVTMKNRSGSRSLHFEFDDKDIGDLLIDGLDASGINWQRND